MIHCVFTALPVIPVCRNPDKEPFHWEVCICGSLLCSSKKWNWKSATHLLPPSSPSPLPFNCTVFQCQMWKGITMQTNTVYVSKHAVPSAHNTPHPRLLQSACCEETTANIRNVVVPLLDNPTESNGVQTLFLVTRQETRTSVHMCLCTSKVEPERMILMHKGCW